MKKLLTVVGVIAFAVALTGCKKTKYIEIGVDNIEMGNAIVEQFKKDFDTEEFGYELKFVEKGGAGLAEEIGKKQSDEVDIALVIGGEVIGREANFAPLKDSISGVSSQLHDDLDTIGGSNQVYAPAFYDGMAFSYNHTLMTEILGEDYEVDETSKLPVAFNTWEKIMAFSNAAQAASTEEGTYSKGTWDGTTFTAAEGDAAFTEVFPVSIDEPWSGYALLTNAGFNIFNNDSDLNDVGYSSDEFKDALDFLVELRNNKVAYGAKSHLVGSTMGWRWDDMLAGKYLFGQVGTWMDVDGKETENNLDIKFSYMPKYNDTQGAPFIKTKGFVINKYIGEAKIEAAGEIVEWLYTKDVMQVMVDNSSYLTSHKTDAAIAPNFTNENSVEMIYALAINESEPLHKLSNNDAKTAMDIYYNEVNKTFMYYVWDGKDADGKAYTSTQAQAALVDAQTKFLADNNK